MILKVGALVLGAILLIPILIGGGVSGAISVVLGSSSTLTCVTSGDTSASVAGYGKEQLANAATIVGVGQRMNVPEHGLVVALAAAMQESTLNNVDYGDRDSLGLFQQRPSQGWGTPAQIMNPTYAATQFYQHLLAVPGWQRMSVNDAAQAVQRSGTPTAYAKHENAARAVLAAVHGAQCTVADTTTVGSGDCNAIQAPNPTALAAINYACGQRGLPYVWGGDGPQEGGFDCSGLTKAAYSAAGITLPRTAHTQFHAGPRVPAGQPLLPGDLVFYGNPATKIHHVGLYIGGGLMIDAPDRGQAKSSHT
ncbi:cell wall-associated NlpC family hydrolase [Kibdelosporangium phytohabitans]|nr:cell wall-associated NlpC family hydrolase [Kibdelosporangium phytohabitans]